VPAGVLAGVLAVVLAVAGCTTTPDPPEPDVARAGAAPAGGTGPGPRSAPPDVPPDLALPDEGGRSTSPEFTDWTTDTDPARPWLLDPCSPTDYPTDRQRTSFRTVEQTGPEAHSARQLAIYPSPEVAAEVMAGFRRVLDACRTGTTPLGSRWQWVSRDEASLGDDGLLAASTEGGPEFAPAGDRVAVTRVGAAVFLAYGSGEFSTAEFDGAAKQAQLVVLQFLDSL
jgi:hypothetical protein